MARTTAGPTARPGPATSRVASHGTGPAAPLTWRQRWARWWRPPRRLGFTREGRYFIGITFAVGLAAINTGNNLLYLLLGMLLSLIVASGVLSEMALRGLEVSRTPPARAHAKSPFLVGIQLTNGKLRLPSFSIEVEDIVDGKPLDKKCYFLKLPAGRTQSTSYRHTVPRRGRITFTGLTISTKFPFALFRKSRTIDLAGELVVFPPLLPIARPAAPRSRILGEQMTGRMGRRGEQAGLRDLREGDDPRDIHWRATARRGRPMVREYEDETARRVALFLDNGLPAGADEAKREGLERAVSLAASLAVDYLERGYAVQLVARGEGLPHGWVRGRSQIPRLLTALALLPSADPDEPFTARPDAGADPILVVPRGGRRAFGRVLEA